MFMDPFRASLRQTNTLHHKVYVYTLNQLLLHKLHFWQIRPSTDHRHGLLAPHVAGKVTNIKEGKTKKCEQYWPAESGRGQSYGPFNMSLMEQHIFADYTIRTIQLVVSKINCSGILNFAKRRFWP